MTSSPASATAPDPQAEQTQSAEHGRRRFGHAVHEGVADVEFAAPAHIGRLRIAHTGDITEALTLSYHCVGSSAPFGE